MKKFLIVGTSLICLTVIGIFAWQQQSYDVPSIPMFDTAPIDTPIVEEKPVVFTEFSIQTTNPKTELTELVGADNIPILLAINHIDISNLKKGMSVMVPDSFEHTSLKQFMPSKIQSAEGIKKLIVIYQRTQAFGFYENGILVRSGPVSSGRQANITPDGLYFANWKGKRVISTVDDSWVLKWNFNIDSDNGIGLHQYALPGYPASHSCVRMFEYDAIWMYDWADQWILDDTGQIKIANGTPVIVYGPYEFEKNAPYKELVTNPKALEVSADELNAVVSNYLETILKEQAHRENVITQQRKEVE